jgi:hypothetical protein
MRTAISNGLADDAEYAAFVAENAGGDGLLILGRITYELMAAFWPTADAMAMLRQLPKA